MRSDNVRHKYRLKPRAYVFAAVLLSLVLGAAIYFFGTGDSAISVGGKEAAAQNAQGWKIAMAARVYIADENLRYDDSYHAGGYPPAEIGVCTDVVWKGLGGVGVIVKDLVDRDISEHPEAYDDVISVQDPNIDFRLVPQLERFLQRNAEVLTNDIDDWFAWQAGDIVTFESSHVAVVSDRRNLWGRPYIIQHGKDPAAEEDRIYAADGMEISGHFRWPLQR